MITRVFQTLICPYDITIYVQDDLNALSNEPTRGCQWKSLLEWYLQQCQQELVNLEAFDIKKKTINQVIKRMIKHDGKKICSAQIYLQVYNNYLNFIFC